MIQQFLSSFIPDIKTKTLIYNGDIGLGKKTIDVNSSMSWYRNTKPILEEVTYTINLFGNKIVKSVPVLSLESSKKYVSKQAEFNTLLKTYSKGGIISDEFYQILNKLFMFLEVVEVTYQKKQMVGFRRLEGADAPLLGQVDIKLSDTHSMSVNVETILPQLSKEDFRYSNIALLIREVSTGFTSFREHSIVNQASNGTYTQQNFKIGQDLIIHIKDQVVLDVQAKETEYDIKKLNGMWTVMKHSKVVCLSDEFVPIETVPQEDGSLIIKLFGAYTHILRNILGYNPQSWQYKHLMKEKRLNVIAGCRRAGKTMHSTYKIYRLMYRNPSSSKHKHRQPKGLYIAPSEDKFKAVLDYIDASSEKIKVLKILKFNSKMKRLILSDEVLDKNRKPMSTVVSTFDFISGKGYEPGRGNGSDEIIIDEAGYIAEDIYLTLLPIIENEQANLYAISTIDWETPKHWFYELLICYEQEGDVDGYAQRVTIDDIDDTMISPQSKERMKRALNGNLQRYYAELYATFPAINSVFGTTHFFIMANKNKVYEEIIIGYDPAKRSDFGGVVICGICTENDEKKMYIIEEYKLQGDYNPYQKDFLMNLKSIYINKGIPVHLIMDSTSAGDVVAEIMGNLVDFKVWYTGSSAKPEMDKWGSWKYGKKNLVHMLQILIDTKKVQAFSSLVGLIEEMKNFKMIHGANGNVKYEAATGHDDIVNAAMLCGFYFGFILGQFSTIQYDVDVELRQLRAEFAKNANLYAPFSMRGSAEETKNNIYTF